MNNLRQLLQGKDEHFSKIKDSIYVGYYSEKDNLPNSLNDLSERIIQKGFGLVIRNYIYQDETIYLILINDELCRKANLEHDEIAAVLLHEVGHILNSYQYTLENVPNIVYCTINNIIYDTTNEKSVIERNNQHKLNNEYYADHYAKKHDYGNHLINSFQKYLNTIQPSYKIDFDLRIEKLQSSEVFTGTIWELTD